MDYFNKQEVKDLQWFEDEFNKDLQWFCGTTGTPQYTRWDVECETKGGRRVDVELKMMDRWRDRFDDIYIEPQKLDILNDRLQVVEKTLYINYTSDSKKVYVWDISKINKEEIKYYPSVMIWDKGKNAYKKEPRYGLPKDLCCAIYHQNNKTKKYDRYIYNNKG